MPALRTAAVIAAAALLSVACGAALLPAAAPVAPAGEGVMRKKLTAAQSLLEGLAVRDFGAIETAASDLADLSKRAEFAVLKTPEYQRLAEDFRLNAGDAARAARERNLDAATLAYVRLTMNCVNCHNHIRDRRK